MVLKGFEIHLGKEPKTDAADEGRSSFGLLFFELFHSRAPRRCQERCARGDGAARQGRELG